MVRKKYRVLMGSAFCLALTALSYPAHSQATLADCAKISDHLNRLTCYDKLSRATGKPAVRQPKVGAPKPITPNVPAPTRVTAPSTQPPASTNPVRTNPVAPQVVGNWTVLVEQTGPGTRDIFLRGTALNQMKDASGLPVGYPSLLINCQNSKLTFYIRWPYPVAQKIQRVEYRIDGNKSRVMAMAYSKDFHSTGLWYPAGAKRFIKSLKGKQRILFSLNAENGTPMAAIFPLAGLDEALGRLLPNCPV